MENSDNIYEQKAALLKALSHPIRLCIVRGLLEKGANNVSGMEHCLGQSQSSISQHLAKLKAAGIVTGTRNKNEIVYQLSNEEIKLIIQAVFNQPAEKERA